MNKEQLEGLGLDEEQIKEVFKLNGKAIEDVKANLSTKETELASVKEQLVEANNQIEGFKDLDVEAIKAKADEYKAKFEEAEIKAKEELESVKFEHELENAITNSKARNVKAVKALLDIESLRGSNNRLEDIKQAIESTKVDNDFLFNIEDKKDDKPTFTRPNDTHATGGITQEQFKAMGYKEKVALKQKDTALYDELNK